jgi:hypothetical protein
MKRILAFLKEGKQRLRKYISPVFLVLLGVSFTLWYISKLGYTYTSDLKVEVTVDGHNIMVPCVVEGKGSTLFGYGMYTTTSAHIPLSELKTEIIEQMVVSEEDTVVKRKMRILPVSMQDALSVRFNDLKIVSIGNFPDIDLPAK